MTHNTDSTPTEDKRLYLFISYKQSIDRKGFHKEKRRHDITLKITSNRPKTHYNTERYRTVNASAQAY